MGTMTNVPDIPTVDAVLARVEALSATDIAALAAGYERACGTVADRLWHQALRGRYNVYQPPIIELVGRIQSLDRASMSRIDASLSEAIERARSRGSDAFPHTPARFSARVVLALLWVPLIVLALAVLLYSIAPWLTAVALIALPTGLVIVVLLGRMTPAGVTARRAIQAAAFGAFIGHDLDHSLQGRFPADSIDVLLRPWREALEGQVPVGERQTSLDRVATWLMVGGILALLALIGVAAVVSGGRVFTPDATWATALWVSLGALFLGIALVVIPRLVRRE